MCNIGINIINIVTYDYDNFLKQTHYIDKKIT